MKSPLVQRGMCPHMRRQGDCFYNPSELCFAKPTSPYTGEALSARPPCGELRSNSGGQSRVSGWGIVSFIILPSRFAVPPPLCKGRLRKRASFCQLPLNLPLTNSFTSYILYFTKSQKSVKFLTNSALFFYGYVVFRQLFL